MLRRFLFLFACGLAGAGQLRVLEHDGLARTYAVRAPTKRSSRALVLVLHGRGGSGAAVERLTRFSTLADSVGFIVAYPDAHERRWNDGRTGDGADDVGFLAEVARRVAVEFDCDTTLVYATGMSNGAMMCFRLARERPGLVAAIAPVAGAMPRAALDSPAPVLPVPVLAVSGTLDPLVGYGGGRTLAPVRRSIEYWVRANGCTTGPETLPVANADPRDGTSVRCERWSSGRDGVEVLLYTIEGGGHTWPSGAARKASFGRRSRDIDATAVIWDFFRRHRR